MATASTFISSNRKGDGWFSVGLASSYPDITGPGDSKVAELRFCGQDLAPGCRIFQVPRSGSSQAVEIVESGVVDATFAATDLKDQVLVFKYRGKIHAINHQCPHSSYPLSNGTPFDIEDFGVVLSAGITCPKHGWSFDLFSGQGDRGSYRLIVWEVQLRPSRSRAVDDEEHEVWIRKKQRIG